VSVGAQRNDVIGDPTQPARRGGRRAFGANFSCPLLGAGPSTDTVLPSQRDLRRGATDVDEAVPYAPGDGEVAGVTLPAGKTPAPESGAAEGLDPGEAWTGAVAGENPGEG
jgi:hypothetical protein